MSIRIWPVIPALLGPQVRHDPELYRIVIIQESKTPFTVKKTYQLEANSVSRIYVVGPDRDKDRQMIIYRGGGEVEFCTICVTMRVS